MRKICSPMLLVIAGRESAVAMLKKIRYVLTIKAMKDYSSLS